LIKVFFSLSVILFPIIASKFGNSWVRIVDVALLYIILAIGLNIVVGFAGLLVLGFIAYFAIGSYVTGILSSPQFSFFLESIQFEFPVFAERFLPFFSETVINNGIHLPFWIILPISGLIAAFIALLIGAPTLRLRGDYLAIVTLGFGEIIRIFLNNLNAPVNVTNGPQGINLIDPVVIGNVSLSGEPGSGGIVNFYFFSIPSVTAYYYLFLITCILVIFISNRLQFSRLGRAWIAIREDEIAAQAMGINVHYLKLLAFAVGASFAGIAGALFGAFQGFISPESFSLTESIAVLSMVVLGGIGNIPGVILGAVILAALPEVLRHTVEPIQMFLFGNILVAVEVLRQLLYGLALVLIMLLRPEGLWPQSKN
tara:strand:- start:2791 stop:3900 length:1110 start_codon:yes stop_codon:yes gene_type:complete